MNKMIAFVFAFLILVFVSTSMLFVVDQRRFAIVFGLGAIKRVVTEPGLYFKLPPPFERIEFVDKRIQTIDSVEPDRYITTEKKNLLVNLFVKWRVIDAQKYFISFRGNTVSAEDRLKQIIRSALNEEFTKRTINEVVSTQRQDVMQAVRRKVEQDASAIGIRIVDVRLKRVDLMAEISESVYQRMVAERKEVANKLRSQGAREAEKIRANADAEREVILANAYKESQEIRGQGDALATAAYAQAYNKNPEFYSFYKSLEAYRDSFKSSKDIIIADPSSSFFRFMRNSSSPRHDANEKSKSKN